MDATVRGHFRLSVHAPGRNVRADPAGHAWGGKAILFAVLMEAVGVSWFYGVCWALSVEWKSLSSSWFFRNLCLRRCKGASHFQGQPLADPRVEPVASQTQLFHPGSSLPELPSTGGCKGPRGISVSLREELRGDCCSPGHMTHPRVGGTIQENEYQPPFKPESKQTMNHCFGLSRSQILHGCYLSQVFFPVLSEIQMQLGICGFSGKFILELNGENMVQRVIGAAIAPFPSRVTAQFSSVPSPFY